MIEDAPKSPNRRRVLTAVRDNPGLCLQELSDMLGLTRTALTHHLRALEAMGAVASVRQGRRVMLFPSTINRPAERSVLGLMRLASARAVLASLFQEPTVSYRQLAAGLNMTPHSIRWHVARLERQGLIHVMPAGIGGHVIHFHPSVRASFAQQPSGGLAEGPSPPPGPGSEMGPQPPEVPDFEVPDFPIN